VKRFTHILELLMENAPNNFEVIGQIWLQTTICSFIGVVIVTSI
jgi:hypothetical protein